MFFYFIYGILGKDRKVWKQDFYTVDSELGDVFMFKKGQKNDITEMIKGTARSMGIVVED